jgi:uncharacterized protein
LPYKEKKKTRATIAISKGLEPLANFMLLFNDINALEEAKKYLSDDTKTTEEALQGAKDILAENFSDDHTYREICKKIYFIQWKD